MLDKVRRKFHGDDSREAVQLGLDLGAYRYGEIIELRVGMPAKLPADAAGIVAPILGRAITDARDLVKRISRLERAGHAVNVYPDAEEYIQSRDFPRPNQRPRR